MGESRRVTVGQPTCWLARYGHMELGDPMPPCAGQLIRAHLIPRQLLLRSVPAESSGAIIHDPRGWVWACGGVMGNAGHHGLFDQSRRLRVRRAHIPQATEELAQELDIVWWLDLTYGER